MTTRNTGIVIYSWAIPKGGLFKVIKKEFDYLSKRIGKPAFVTSEPVPAAYEEEFRQIKGVSLSSDATNSRDISFFFPGLDMSISGGITGSVRRIYSFLRQERPDAILTHQLLSAFLIIPYTLVHRTRVILVLHDNPFMFMEHEPKKRIGMKSFLLRNIAYRMEKFTIRRSKAVICTTSHIKQSVVKHLGDAKNMFVADYGIDAFPRVGDENRDVLLTVTKWSRFRKPEEYLEILKHLPESLSLTVAGRWDSEEDLAAFLGSVRSKGLEGRVNTLGDITESELSRLYDRTRVFLRLGFNETGTGQAILEAIGHGCPVVVSKGLGASEIISDGGNGFLVDENQPEEIASRIKEIYSSDELFETMSEAAYALAESSDWESYLLKILDTIKS